MGYMRRFEERKGKKNVVNSSLKKWTKQNNHSMQLEELTWMKKKLSNPVPPRKCGTGAINW